MDLETYSRSLQELKFLTASMTQVSSKHEESMSSIRVEITELNRVLTRTQEQFLSTFAKDTKSVSAQFEALTGRFGNFEILLNKFENQLRVQ